MTRILVTGGAGFVGSALALGLAQRASDAQVIALDNLKRRGSELALSRLARGGVEFIHGDVRCPEDLEAVGDIDVLVECSAEPSVQAGYGEDPRYLIHTNLNGTQNCLEHARRCGATVIFLSTSRVYPIAALRDLPLTEDTTRLTLREGASGPGWSMQGIASDFSLAGSRSLYGATKLSAEHLIEEYASLYDLPTVIDRCGVIAGPWQMGRVDQGFVSLWASRHLFGGALAYCGFGGLGLQVRDMLHVEDLCELIAIQMKSPKVFSDRAWNVGGGLECSVSLRELTTLCERLSGEQLQLASVVETHPSDVPWYITDAAMIRERSGWTPRRSVEQILDDIFRWLVDHRAQLRGILY